MKQMNINELSIEEQIIAVLNVIRPYLNNDGGDIEFVRFEEGIVYVRMLGACAGCMSLDQTLNEGVREILVENIPGVIEVVNILREAGCNVLGIASIFTYNLKKGIDRLQEANIENHSLSNFEVLAKVAAEQNYIAKEDLNKVLKFQQNPSDPSWME